jgi:replication-associated recombination protein RarA
MQNNRQSGSHPMTFSELTTPGGYKCGEVTSAMQKCIRRGLEEDALFWATELDLAGYPEYVWKRLKIIASEDVGLGDNSAAPTISALYQHWLEQRKKKDTRHAPERLFLVHAVLILCRAAKSRAVDHALIALYEAPREKREIPDFAKDRHTAAGRKLRRGWKHFWSEGAKLANKAELPDPYEAIARKTRVDRQRELDLE